MNLVDLNSDSDSRLSVQILLLGLYFGLAPVYWLPGISISSLRAVKFVLIALGLSVVYSKSMLLSKPIFPSGMVGPLGLMFLLISAFPAFLLAPTNSIILSNLLEYFMGFIVLWCFYLIQKHEGDNFILYKISVFLILIFSVLTVVNFMTGIPKLYAPVEFIEKPLWVAGFGAGRTGWSNGITYYAVISLCFAFTSSRKSVRFVYLAAFMGIFLSQLIAAGRAGILVSIVAPILFLILLKKWRLVLVMSLVLIVLVVYAGGMLTDSLRFNRLLTSEVTMKQIDHFSAGRISGYLFAIDLATKEPLFGYGFGHEKVKYETQFESGKEIHNLWLKLLVEGGIFLPLSFLMFSSYVLIKINRNVKYLLITSANNVEFVALYCVFISGIIISMFEPNALIGSLQVSAIWWAAIGSLLGLIDHRRGNNIAKLA